MHIATDHKRHRSAAYERELPIGDQLDVIWAIIGELASDAPMYRHWPEGESPKERARAMIDRVAAIKARYPKPTKDAP